MPITARCPSCGGTVKAPDHLAGRTVKCPKCTAAITLPAAAGDPGAIRTAPPPGPTPAPLPPADPVSAGPPPRPARAPAVDEDFEEDAPRRRDDYVAAPSSAGNGMAIAGMVLGIIGFLLAFIPCFGWVLAIVLGIIGATLSGIGLGTASRAGGGKGMAISGLVLSILAILWGPVWFFVIWGTMLHGAQNALQVAAAQAQNRPMVVINGKQVPAPFFPPAVQAVQGDPTPASGKLTMKDRLGTLDGTLAANDPRDRARPNSVCKVYTVSLTAGKTYQIDLIAKEPGIDPYLRLEDPAGNPLAQDDDSGGFPNARLLFVCPQNGEYRLVATTFAGGTGSFTLKVAEQ